MARTPPETTPDQLSLEDCTRLTQRPSSAANQRGRAGSPSRQHHTAQELLETPDALLTRTHLRELGLERRAVDAVFRALPVVALPGYSRPLIRADHYRALVERYTYRDDRVRPTPCLAPGSNGARPPTATRATASSTGSADARARHRYAGSFADEARSTRAPVAGSPASSPRYACLSSAASRTRRSAPTLAEAAEQWRASRVDVTDGTAVGHRVQLARVLPLLGSRRVDEITPADVAELVAALHAVGRKRETIRKSVTVLAQVLDFAGVKDNPARDRVHVRLPREERHEPTPARRPTKSKPS